MTKSTPLLQLQSIADMSVIVCYVRLSVSHVLNGLHLTMACLSGRKLPESCQKVARKFPENCQKVAILLP